MTSLANMTRSLLIVVAVASAAHAASGAGDWIHGIYTKGSPAPRALPSSITLKEARAFAARTEGATVITGRGNSMAPLYPDGTVLVVARRAYTDLVRGMTVVYRNRANRSVAHVLIARAKDGWRVAGLNNPRHDGEGVDDSNLVGVVVAAFQPVPGILVSQR